MGIYSIPTIALEYVAALRANLGFRWLLVGVATHGMSFFGIGYDYTFNDEESKMVCMTAHYTDSERDIIQPCSGPC